MLRELADVDWLTLILDHRQMELIKGRYRLSVKSHDQDPGMLLPP